MKIGGLLKLLKFSKKIFIERFVHTLGVSSAKYTYQFLYLVALSENKYINKCSLTYIQLA